MRIFLGTDFGGTKIRAGAVEDESGRIVARADVPTEAERGVAAVVENLDRALRQAAARAGVETIEDVAGIGIAAPGQIERASGAVIQAPNLGWLDVPLGAMLRERYRRVPIAIENDVNAAAVGEYRHGAAREFPEARDLALLFVGTGIGGGFIANGELVSGATGAAGELGHMVYRTKGRRCSCGGYGHFEAYAGGRCVEEAYGAPLAEIFSAAARGDERARHTVDELEGALAVLAGNVATFLNPAVLVVGGGVARRQSHVVEVCREGVERAGSRAAALACRVVASTLWEDAAVLGSAELVRSACGQRGARSAERSRCAE